MRAQRHMTRTKTHSSTKQSERARKQLLPFYLISTPKSKQRTRMGKHHSRIRSRLDRKALPGSSLTRMPTRNLFSLTETKKLRIARVERHLTKPFPMAKHVFRSGQRQIWKQRSRETQSPVRPRGKGTSEHTQSLTILCRPNTTTQFVLVRWQCNIQTHLPTAVGHIAPLSRTSCETRLSPKGVQDIQR